MREAIGGAWLIGIVAVIIVVFTSYLAFSVNYSKAFKIKDGIIERIEKYNGMTDVALEQISTYMNSVQYNQTGLCTHALGEGAWWAGVYGKTAGNTITNRYNYCVERVTSEGGNGNYRASYYKVTVFYGISISVVDLSGNFMVTGETKMIYYPKDFVRFDEYNMRVK